MRTCSGVDVWCLKNRSGELVMEVCERVVYGEGGAAGG